MTSLTSANNAGGRRGFTLVEMLAVLGIIALLIGILLPALLRALAAAEHARTSAELSSIAAGLEAYKSDFGDYPRSTNLPASPVSANRGSKLLLWALIAPFPVDADPASAAADPNDPTDGLEKFPADGAQGPGFRARFTAPQAGPDGTMYTADDTMSGRVYGPYLAVDKFKFSVVSPFQLQDRNGNPILYFPARPVRPNIGIAPQFVDDSASAGKALYDVRYGDETKLTLDSMRYLLGDNSTTAPNGAIDSGETPAYTGPYILWAAGEDGQYGIPSPPNSSAANACDDVTNFR